jgi:hypothetical protein
MAYLDYSDRFLNGTWRTVPSGYWSPGFPALVAVIRRVVGMGATGDVPALRIGYALGYFVSIAGFALLLRALRRCASDEASSPAALVLTIAGWALFLWAALDLTQLGHTTPDSWVSAATYWATAAALYVTVPGRAWGAAVGLGIALGAGYLIKAIMLPVGALLLVTLLASQLVRRCTVMPTILAVVVFALVSTPQVLVQSRLTGGPSIGRVGSLVHAWYVEDVPCPLFGVPKEREKWPTCIQPRPGNPDPIAPQPIPRLTRDPSVYVFHTPPDVTFAAWYDPTQWYARLHAPFSLHRQIVDLAKNLGADWRVLTPFAIAAAVLALALGAPEARDIESLLVVPSVGTLGAYALSFSSTRYLGPAFALFVLGFARVPLRCARDVTWVPPRRLALAFAACAVVLLVNAVVETADETLYSSRHTTNELMERAHALAATGLAPGMRVGIIGDGSNAYWARIDRLRIVAEVHPVEAMRYFANTPEKQDSVIRAFTTAGAHAIVADPAPDWPATLPPGWVRVAGAGSLAVLRL